MLYLILLIGVQQLFLMSSDLKADNFMLIDYLFIDKASLNFFVDQ